jgi:hypothetical protein
MMSSLCREFPTKFLQLAWNGKWESRSIRKEEVKKIGKKDVDLNCSAAASVGRVVERRAV